MKAANDYLRDVRTPEVAKLQYADSHNDDVTEASCLPYQGVSYANIRHRSNFIRITLPSSCLDQVMAF